MIVLPPSGVPPWSNNSLLDHRSLPPVFESRHGHIWRVFHLWACFITFEGRSAHLAYHVHKSGRKTSIIVILPASISIGDWCIVLGTLPGWFNWIQVTVCWPHTFESVCNWSIGILLLLEHQPLLPDGLEHGTTYGHAVQEATCLNTGRGTIVLVWVFFIQPGS